MNLFIKQSFLLVTLFFLQHNFCFAQVKKDTTDIKSTIALLDKHNIVGLDEVKFQTDKYYRSAVKAAIIIESYFPGKANDLRKISKREQVYMADDVANNPKAKDIYEYIIKSDLDTSGANLINLCGATAPKSGIFTAMYSNPESEAIILYIQNELGFKFTHSGFYGRIGKKIYNTSYQFSHDLLFMKNVFGLNIGELDFVELPTNAFNKMVNTPGLDNQNLLENIKRLIDDGVLGPNGEMEIPSGDDVWMTHRNSPYLELYKQHYILKIPKEERIRLRKVDSLQKAKETKLLLEKNKGVFDLVLKEHKGNIKPIKTNTEFIEYCEKSLTIKKSYQICFSYVTEENGEIFHGEYNPDNLPNFLIDNKEKGYIKFGKNYNFYSGKVVEVFAVIALNGAPY